MGMYTEILIKADIEGLLPVEVREVLNCLFNGGECPEQLPDHQFFNSTRWEFIGTSSSYYHIPWATSNYRDDYLFSRSDLKNYDGVVQDFFHWLDPYVAAKSGTCIGYIWYEEDNEPTLIYKR